MKDVVRVWIRILPRSSEDVLKLIKDRTKDGLPTKGYDKWKERKGLLEVNCFTREWKTISYIDLNLEGVILESITNPIPKWQFIPPESMIEELYKIVCPPKGKK